MAAEQRKEVEIGVWRRSPWTFGFWWRTILTLGLYVILLWNKNQITVTNRRVMQRRGNILGGRETTMNLEKVTDISLDVPPLGSIFNYGSIVIQTAGSSGAEISFDGLGQARRLRDVIFDLRDGQLDETV